MDLEKTQPVEESQLNSVLFQLEGVVETLQDKFSALAKKIEPILLPDTPAECTEKDRCSRDTKLAENLQKIVDRIDLVNKFIYDTTKRIDI